MKKIKLEANDIELALNTANKRFIGNCESIEEFESQCAALDNKKTLFGD